MELNYCQAYSILLTKGTNQLITLDLAHKSKGIIFRLQAIDSTEETHSTAPDMLILLKNVYKDKTLIELTPKGSVMIFTMNSQEHITDKYTFLNSSNCRHNTPLKTNSTPIYPMVFTLFR